MARTVRSLCAALALLLQAGPLWASPQGTPEGPDASFVIENVRVFTGDHTIEQTNVVVEDGRITGLGQGLGRRGLRVIEGTGHTLIPGLIDAHAHVLSEGHMRNALRFGVTTQLDMFTRVEFMQAQRLRRASIEPSDLADLYSAGAPVTSPGGMGTQFGIPFPTIAGPQDARAFVRARLKEGSDYVKIIYEPSVGIFSTISRETLRAVVRAAHDEGALAVVHISSLEGARHVVDAGADGLAHAFGDQLIDDALVAEIARRSMFVTPTLTLFAAISGEGVGPGLTEDQRLAPYLTPGQRASLTQPAITEGDPMAAYLTRFQLANALENVRRLNAAGIRILAGDDAPNLGAHGVSMHGELVLLTRAGLTPAQALRAATLAPAEAFKLTDRGRIAPGARADLVLVEGNPLTDILATRAIARVFKKGREVPRPKQVPG